MVEVECGRTRVRAKRLQKQPAMPAGHLGVGVIMLVERGG